MIPTIDQTCVPCVVGTLDANANCCTEDRNCGNDTNCLFLVHCSALCAGNTACTGSCQTMLGDGAAQNLNFTQFVSCLQVTCPQCPAL
jgi:hypothetical protein